MANLMRAIRTLATTARSPAEAVAAWTRPYTAGLLTAKELQQFWDDGFVIKHNVFHPDELKPCMKAIDELVDALAQKLFRGGKIKDLCSSAGFYERLTLIEKQFPSASVLLHKHGILPPAVQQLWSSKPLMSAATQVLGEDLAGHPVWNLRCKTPRQEQATVPWHQDAAYLNEAAWQTLQLTAWVPMLDANKENGCMQMMRGGHRTGKVANHTCCWGNTWYVDLPLDEMRKIGINPDKDLVTCEVPLGSVLFLNNLIPHRSLDNTSSRIRWSFDLRWQKPTEPTGFEDVKEMIIMKKASDPSFQIDWQTWAGLSRAPGEVAAASTAKPLTEEDFDTTISGPWMTRWPITHHNRHTRSLDAGQKGVKGWHKA